MFINIKFNSNVCALAEKYLLSKDCLPQKKTYLKIIFEIKKVFEVLFYRTGMTTERNA